MLLKSRRILHEHLACVARGLRCRNICPVFTLFRDMPFKSQCHNVLRACLKLNLHWVMMASIILGTCLLNCFGHQCNLLMDSVLGLVDACNHAQGISMLQKDFEFGSICQSLYLGRQGVSSF